jgi:hypothetical protein
MDQVEVELQCLCDPRRPKGKHHDPIPQTDFGQGVKARPGGPLYDPNPGLAWRGVAWPGGLGYQLPWVPSC